MFTIQQITTGLLLNNSIILTNIPTSIDVTTQYYSNYANFIKINNESTKNFKFENQLTYTYNNYSGRIVCKNDNHYFQLLTNSYSEKDLCITICPNKYSLFDRVDDETNKLINSFIDMIYPIFPYGGLNTYYCRHANTHPLYKSMYRLDKIIVGGLICEQEIMLIPKHKSFSIKKSDILKEYKDEILNLISINSEEIKKKFYKDIDLDDDDIMF